MNAEEAAVLLGPVLGYVPSRQQVALAFLDVDQVAMRAEIAARYRWERWDQESPINGVAAETIKASRDDFEGGEVYLIYIDEALVFFQPFDPADGSKITEEALPEVAGVHVDQLVDEAAQDVIVHALAAAITPAAQTADQIVVGNSVSTVRSETQDRGPGALPLTRVIETPNG